MPAREWVGKSLAPTTNQIAPRMVFANVLWEWVVNKALNPNRCRAMAAKVNTVLTAQNYTVSVNDLCHLVRVS